MQQARCDVSVYSNGECQIIEDSPLQTITCPLWQPETLFIKLSMKPPDLYFSFNNFNDLDNYGADLVPGRVSNDEAVKACSPLLIDISYLLLQIACNK